MNALTDEQLMEQLKNGETEAIDELYRRYSGKLYAFCRNITRSEDSDDLVHDVFTRVIESASTFKPGKASFRTWLFRIARNRCIDFTRREGKIQFVPIEETVAQSGSVDVEGAIIRKSLIETVRECLDELKNEQEKYAILLYYISGKVYREIGGILGRSTSMAKNRVRAAQEKVKRCLERKGVDSAA